LRDRIVCFGDIIDDVVVVPNGPIRHDTDTSSTIVQRPGGSPANTAAWLGSLGAGVDFVGVVAAGDAARHAALLPGVVAHVREHASLPTGTIVVIVEGESRSMLTSRGANAALDPADAIPELLANTAVLHLTGHALLNDAGAQGFMALIARARAAGADVSVSPGSVGFIADYGVAAFREAIAGASILFPSLDEGRLLTGLDEPFEVAAALAQDFETVVLTLGAEGVVVGGELIPAVAAKIVDPTGAGDALCAGFLHEWVRSRDATAAALAGVALAARAVEVRGGRPPA
jgi:sugar/nucleoside kinase (ribokinase family)